MQKIYALLIALISISTTFAQEVIWPTPTPPAGSNPTAFAAPRTDWFDRFDVNRKKATGEIDLVFDGDSITDGWQGVGRDVWKQNYEPLKAIDFGISGDRVENVLWRLQKGQTANIKPKLVVLMIGTNNLGRHTDEQIADGIKNLVEEYKKACPTAHILLLAIFPRGEKADHPSRARIININKTISQLGDGKRVTYLDIGSKFLAPDGTLPKDVMPDSLHPNAKGYEIWASAIQSEIDKHLPKK